MSRAFEIHQDNAIEYDESGRRAFSTTYYIKLDESAEVMLKKLKGARLSFFTCISLHEIAVLQRDEPPYSIVDISRVTDYSIRALKDAAAWLIAHEFAVVSGTTLHGEKLYRPTDTYAWFGQRREPPADDSYAKTAQLAQDTSRAKKVPRYAKTAKEVCKNQQEGMQKPDTVVRRRLTPNSSGEITPSSPEALERLMTAGLFTADRDFGNAGITLDQARAIADWIAHPTGYNEKIKDPASFARKCLLRNHEWLRFWDAPPNELQLVGAENSHRSEFDDFNWHRMSDTNRRHIIAIERGLDIDSVADDPHYGCTHQRET